MEMDEASMESPVPFPEGWIEQLRPLLGAALPDFLHSYLCPPTRGVRMRPGAMPPPDALKPVPWAENAWYLSLDSTAGAQPAHEAGAYYLQEPSAMAPAAVLHPLPGERVLDLCAAPGGKSTQLAAYLQGRGLIVCNEPVGSRAQILSRNIERMGVCNAIVVSALPEELSPRWPGFFDKVLVDAPCSGEGMFRRHPETRLEWNTASPAGCAGRQLQILTHAARMLRPGGRLVYSTCTFNPTENEGVIQAFLSQHPDFSLRPFQLPGLAENEGMLHLWPHEIQGEGHFVALLERNQETEEATAVRRKKADPSVFPAPTRDQLAAAHAFLADQFIHPPVPNILFAGRLSVLPVDAPPLTGVKVLRAGLQLGEVKGKLFLPDHALALAQPGLRSQPVDEAAARAYQSGQPLPCADTLRGWVLPALGGLQLGWAKASDGFMKNHYPKGLRR